MTTLAEELIEMRLKYDMTQREFARMAGVSINTYMNLERERLSEQSPSAKAVRDALLWNENKIRRIYLRRRRAMDTRRIPNIPDFYERFYTLCNPDGSLRKEFNEEEQKTLKELQYELGVADPEVEHAGPPSWTERKRFADLLKEYRGDIPKTEFSRRLGMTMGSYNGVETELRSTKSRAMQDIVNNQYFTKEQRHRLRRVFYRMKNKEALEE